MSSVVSINFWLRQAMETDQSSAYSIRYVVTRRMQNVSFGKIPTTLVRLWISQFNRSIMLEDEILWSIVKSVDKFSQKIFLEKDIKPDSRRVFLFRQVLTCQENHMVSQSYRILRYIGLSITVILAKSDMFSINVPSDDVTRKQIHYNAEVIPFASNYDINKMIAQTMLVHFD